jgi:hypothetical protein
MYPAGTNRYTNYLRVCAVVALAERLEPIQCSARRTSATHLTNDSDHCV